jgi:hypothetical protein
MVGMAGSRALATGLGPLVNRLGVAGRHAQPMAAERFGQRRPGGPCSCAAALTLPSCPARAKACSAPAQSIRNRLACQPTRSCGAQAPSGGAGDRSEILALRLGLKPAPGRRACLVAPRHAASYGLWSDWAPPA